MDNFVFNLPICSVCTAHLFCSANPPLQLLCRHLFCGSCITDLRTAYGYLCPFCNTVTADCVVNAELLRVAKEGIAALQHKDDPRCIPFLKECYIFIIQETNTEHVPCRSYYKNTECKFRNLCPYDHTPGAATRGLCPRGMACPKIERCVFDHQPPYRHVPLDLKFHQVKPWYAQQHHCIEFIELPQTDAEFKAVEARFRMSLTNPILKIERVQNAKLYVKFAHKHETLSVLHGSAVDVKSLYHGTSKQSPYEVCKDTCGLDSRLSRPGMWGKGSYFAKTARYSYNYSHKLDADTRTLLECDVIVGDAVELTPDQGLTRPPKNPSTNEEYNSVKGRAGGDEIWITYEPGMSYPQYLITFNL